MTARTHPSPMLRFIPSQRLTFLWKEALVFLACVLVSFAGKQYGEMLVGAVLIAWSLRNATSAMQSMTLLVPLSSLNYSIVPNDFNSMVKWAAIFIISGAAIYHCVRGHRMAHSLVIPRWMITFLLFLLIATLVSIAVSALPVVSIFKLVSFAVGVFGVMAIFWDRNISLDYCYSWLYTLFATVLFASALLIPLSMGYFPRTNYFQGILNQSQAYGIYIVPFTTLLLARWMFSSVSTSWIERIACLVGIFTLYLTHSRTAGMSLTASIGLLLLVGLFRGSVRGQLIQRVVPGIAVFCLLVLIINMVTEGGIERGVDKYIHKGTAKVDTVLASREEKFEEAYQKFVENPWTGIGFGMSLSRLDPKNVIVNKWLGIPLSAPVEGGVMYMALPAQIGIIGVLPFLIFFITFARPIARYAPLPILGLCISALMTNFGEYTFFSIGGMGLYLWLFFAFAHRYGAACGGMDDN